MYLFTCVSAAGPPPRRPQSAGTRPLQGSPGTAGAASPLLGWAVLLLPLWFLLLLLTPGRGHAPAAPRGGGGWGGVRLGPPWFGFVGVVESPGLFELNRGGRNPGSENAHSRAVHRLADTTHRRARIFGRARDPHQPATPPPRPVVSSATCASSSHPQRPDDERTASSQSPSGALPLPVPASVPTRSISGFGLIDAHRHDSHHPPIAPGLALGPSSRRQGGAAAAGAQGGGARQRSVSAGAAGS